MKTVKFLPCVFLLGLLVVLAGSGGLGLAQEAEPPEGKAQPRGAVSIDATVGSRFSYQGRLKEGGRPVTGSRDMTFRLYSDDSCTTQVGDDIVKSGVPVADGLFSVELDVTHDDFNGQGLWLEVEVDGTKIGCQEILPAPYALSLRPGATISGTLPALTGRGGNALGQLAHLEVVSVSPFIAYSIGAYGEGDWGVYGYSPEAIGVRGKSAGSGGTGVYGFAQATSGTTYGVYGKAQSPDGFGGFFENTGGGAAIKAAGRIESTTVSYLWVPGAQIVKNTYEDGLDIKYGWSGSVAIRANAAGDYWVVMPIDVPGILYGQSVRVSDAHIYYQVENSADYIDWTRWHKNTGAGTSVVLAEDFTDHHSTSPVSYSLIADDDYWYLDTSAGGLALSFGLHFEGTGEDREILIGGASVTLGHH